MKAAALVLGIVSALWSLLGTAFAYVWTGMSVALIEGDKATNPDSVLSGVALTAVLLFIFFAVAGVAACMVYVLPRTVGLIMLIATVAAVFVTTLNVFNFVSIIGFALAAIFAFNGARKSPQSISSPQPNL